MRMKKVMFIVEAFGGGIFTDIKNLANRLSDKYQVVIVFNTRAQTPPNYADFFDQKIDLIRLSSFCRSISLHNDVITFFRLKRIIKDQRPDVIHLHSSKAGAIGRLIAGFKESVPVFYTPHGYSFLMNNTSKVQRLVYRSIETVLAKFDCTTVACGQGEYEQARQFDRHPLLINNGVDIQTLQKITLPPVTHENQIVCTSGRIDEQKDPHLFNEIARRMPDKQFIWIGDGQMRDQLTAPNIVITGWLPYAEALKVLSRSDTFVLTSKWEGLSLSLLEAMYLKKLCVVSDVSGNREVITGANGCICTTVDDYVQAISQYSSQKAMLVEQAHQDVIYKYSLDEMVHEYDSCYQKAMRGEVQFG